jgi:hypothetical protein
MIRNTSYNDKEIRQEMNEYVGKPFSLIKRFRIRGNGSPRFRIVDASEKINEILARNKNMINYCNMELREGGVVVGFRSILETYSWSIPYYKLSIHSTGKKYTVYSDTEHITIENDHRSEVNRSFMKKLRSLQSQFMDGSYIDYP